MAAAANRRLLDALEATTRALVERLDADACSISRTLGGVLVLVTEVMPAGRTTHLGHGYLVADYPETAAVLETRRPHAVCLGQPDADPAEVEILLELDFGALLMLPLDLDGRPWGLVEVYRKEPRAFGPVEVRAAAGVLAELA